MNEFARYYIEFVIQLFKNILEFFKTIGEAFAKAFWFDIKDYFAHLGDRMVQFNVLSWILLVIVSAIEIALFVFVIIKLKQLLGYYIRFRRKEIEKDELLYEIAELNQRTSELIDEKNNIIAMKVSQLNDVNMFGYGEGLVSEKEIHEKETTIITGDTKEPGNEFRFTKLIAVDQKYSTINTTINMTPDEMISLPQLIEKFINFSASQLHLYYSKRVIAIYFAAMATSKIVILEGISGTGKTSLPYAMSKFLKNNANIVSVQPSWRDRAEIIGYLNEFTKKFNETDFLKALYEINYREDVNFIVLDEMNLARIEYYFAEFLSIMEMPDISEWKIDLVPKVEPNDPKFVINGKIMVPQNVWFVGTANKDDSTFTITDKVYDRAVTIFLNAKADFFDAPFTEPIDLSYDYLNKLFMDARSEYAISLKNLENLRKVDDFIQDNFKIAFGNRIMKQIHFFVPAYMACGMGELDGLDYIMCTKIFRKFEALNIAFLKDEITALINLLLKLFGKDTFDWSIKYLRDLQRMA